MSIVAPCRGCTDRELGCHGICEKYESYKKALGNERTNAYKAELGNVYYGSFLKQRKERIRKRHRH